MRTTFCHVKIVTPDLPGKPSRTFEWSGPDGQNTLHGLVSVDVSDSVDGLINRFSLQLAPEHFGREDSMAELIPAYSLVQIDMGAIGRDGDGDPTAMIGLTSPAAEHEQWTPAGPQRGITITGRGIECVLQDANVWWAPYLELHQLDTEIDRKIAEPFLEQLTGELIWRKKVVAEDSDPRQAMLGTLFYYLLAHGSSVMNLLLPEDQRIRDLLLPDGYSPELLDAQLAQFPPSPGTKYAQPESWTFIGDTLGVTRLLLQSGTLHPQPGPVLNMLLSLTDREFHEMFVRYQRDPGGGRARGRIMHRVKPFGGPGFAESLEVVDRHILGRRPRRTRFNLDEPSLETVEFTSDDVLASQLTHGMADVRNVFFVSPGQSAMFANSEFKANLAPKVSGARGDYSYIGRYGIRPMEHVTPHMVIGKAGSTDSGAVIDAADKLSELLRIWYDPQPVMLEGSVRVLGRNSYRAGQRAIWRGEANGQPDGRPTREFYVRATQKQYDCASGAFAATLMVSRGWTIADAPAGAGARR